MFINEIQDKKLKKPLEITITKQYIAENDDLELFGEGNTEEEAVADLKEAFSDIYEDLLTVDKYTDSGKEYRDKFLSYVE